MTELEQGPTSPQELTTLTAEIVGAYVGHHKVAAANLPTLITTVGQELAGLGQSHAEPEEEKLVPAVPIKKSVTPDHIICLEDGKMARDKQGRNAYCRAIRALMFAMSRKGRDEY